MTNRLGQSYRSRIANNLCLNLQNAIIRHAAPRLDEFRETIKKTRVF